jgi:hypothetical protein
LAPGWVCPFEKRPKQSGESSTPPTLTRDDIYPTEVTIKD